MKKKISLFLCVAAIMSILSITCLGASVNLINDNAWGSAWDIVPGAWHGILDQGVGGLPAVERTITADGHLLIKSPSDDMSGAKDHGIGNYIGVAGILQPNTTYTLTAEIKFFANPQNPLHVNFGGYDKLAIEYVGDTLGNDPTIVTPSEDFVTYTYTFRTGENLDETYIVVGPNALKNAGGVLEITWGAFAAGAWYEVASCKVLAEGDTDEEVPDDPGDDVTPPENPSSPDTDDAMISIVASAIVMSLGAYVCVQAKKKF